MAMGGAPLHAVLFEVVTGDVVDDQEDFPTAAAAHQLFEEMEEGGAVEDLRELIEEARTALDGDGAVHMRRLAHAERVDPGLDADPRPRHVPRPTEPEARFVLEHHDAAARPGFFLMAGRRTRIQYSCASASARARRLR